jgi:hypothetical protein
LLIVLIKKGLGIFGSTKAAPKDVFKWDIYHARFFSGDSGYGQYRLFL